MTRPWVKKVVKILAIIIVILMIAAFIFSIVSYTFIKAQITESVSIYGLPIIFAISFFLDFLPQYLSAHTLLLITGLLGMNLFIVTLVVLFATFLASVAGFWLGRYVEEDFFAEIFGKKIYDKIVAGMNKYGKWYVAISAISPLPYIPIIFGALGMSWKNFFVWGIIPRLLGFVVTGLFTYFVLVVNVFHF